MAKWAISKQVDAEMTPANAFSGIFTGSTGASILSPQQLGPHDQVRTHAWVTKVTTNKKKVIF